jgi:pimeloyl-ACP methyl ester carboxylesterase
MESWFYIHPQSHLQQYQEKEGHQIMKTLRLVAILGFVLAGIALLVVPSQAAPAATNAGFTPTRFTVQDEGTEGKPDLLLIPGLSSSRAVWDAEAKLLAPKYRLHLVQINGFAGSPAGPNASGPLLAPIVEELHAYIVANKLHPIVMGHSMGGLLTLMLALNHPEDVRKMVIVDALPFAGVLANPAATATSIKPQVELLQRQMMALPADQYAAMQTMLAAQMVKNSDAQKLVATSIIASDRAVTVEAMAEDIQTDLRADVASIKMPVLVLYAIDPEAQQPDPAKYEATVQAAYKPMPKVKLVKIDSSRHYIMYDQPQKFDAAVKEFLK